jgi:hypothetical protein
MRDDVVSSALAGIGIEANVGGQTAAAKRRRSSTIATPRRPRLPLFIAGVVGLSMGAEGSPS